jgi:ParB/RepB/Spo0J family partition protein
LSEALDRRLFSLAVFFPAALSSAAVAGLMGDVEGAAQPRTIAAGTVHRQARTVLTALPLSAVRANAAQPRRYFDPDALRDLAASIRQRGVLQPVIVKRDDAGYVIMAGERRFRAAKMAGLSVIPALVRDDDPIEVAMIENLQREDLSPLEEAEGLGSLLDQYGYTHESLAELIGKSRPYVSNTLALRRLPERIKAEYHQSPEVSREILISVARADTPERQEMLWRLTRIRKLSVQRFRSAQAGRPGAADEIAELERLVRRLGRKLRALDTAALPPDQRSRLTRVLERAQSRVARSLDRLAEESANAAAGVAEDAESPRGEML